MKYVFIFSFVLYSFVSHAQLDSCDQLYLKFNPKYLSSKTTSLIINDLYANCINTSNSAKAKSNGGTGSAGCQGINNPCSGERSRANPDFINVVDQSLDSLSNPGFIATAPDAAVEEVIQNEENPQSQNTEAQEQEEVVNSLLSPPEFTSINGCIRLVRKAPNVFTSAPNDILIIPVGPCINFVQKGYDHHTQYTIDKKDQVDIDDLLIKRLSVQGKEFKECQDKGGRQGDCFSKVVLTQLSKKTKETENLRTIKKNIGNGISDKKAASLVDMAEQQYPDLYTKTNVSLSEIEKKLLDEELAAKLDTIETAREKDAEEIFSVADSLSSEIDMLLDTVEMMQEKQMESSMLLKNNAQNLDNGSNDVNCSDLIENIHQSNELKESYSALSDMMMSGGKASERLALRRNCLEGVLPCDPRTALQMGSEGSEERTQFESTVNLHSKFIVLDRFSSQVNQIKIGLDKGVDFSESLNLSGSDQEKIAKGLQYASTGLNIAVGFASAYKGDPQGLIQGIQGISALVGGPLKPSPSPEMLAIEQLRKQMNDRFDRVDGKLDNIQSTQLEIGKNLSSSIQINREVMQFEFSNVNYSLADITKRQLKIQQDLAALLKEDLNNCNTLFPLISDNPLLEYQELKSLYNNAAVQPCMEGIRNALNASNLNSGALPSLNYFELRVDPAGDTYFNSEVNTFYKLSTFYQWYYGDNLNNRNAATNLLLLQPDIVSSSFKIYKEFRNDARVDDDLNPSDVLGSFYIDAYTFRDFVTLYTKLFPYFEVGKSGDDFEPLDLENLISASSSDDNLISFEDRFTLLENRAISLTKIQRITEAQQALMSGNHLLRPFYAILYEGQYAGTVINYNSQTFPVKQFIIDILSKNPVLAQNFAIYVLRKNFRLNESIYLDQSIWSENMARNPAAQKLMTYGYGGLPTFKYLPGDSINIESDNLTSVIIDSLYEGQHIDSLLDFGKYSVSCNDIAYLQIETDDCLANNFVNCSVRIPFPESTLLFLDKFSYTEAFEFSREAKGLLYELSAEVLFAKSVPDDWQQVMNWKSLFIPSP